MKCSNCSREAKNYYPNMGYLCDKCENKPMTGGQFIGFLLFVGLVISIFVVPIAILGK